MFDGCGYGKIGGIGNGGRDERDIVGVEVVGGRGGLFHSRERLKRRRLHEWSIRSCWSTEGHLSILGREDRRFICKVGDIEGGSYCFAGENTRELKDETFKLKENLNDMQW